MMPMTKVVLLNGDILEDRKGGDCFFYISTVLRESSVCDTRTDFLRLQVPQLLWYLYTMLILRAYIHVIITTPYIVDF